MTMVISGDGNITGLTAGGLPDATVVDADLSLTANSAPIKTALNASGSAPIHACRAWVNFNGTGTVAIRASGNVSSITDNGTGNYTVNFTTAMPDTNYAVVASAGLDSAVVTRAPAPGSSVTSSSVQVDSTDLAQSARIDISSYSVAIFR